MLSSFFIGGQCSITNGTFTTSSCTNQADAFSLGCVQGWNASHGSPTIFGSGNTTRAWMWANSSNRGEGIATNFNFVAGKTYTISYDIRKTTQGTNVNPGNSRAILRATTGLNVIAYTTTANVGGDPIPAAPSGSEIVHSSLMSTNLNGAMQTVTTQFTATQNNSQLWIYPSRSRRGQVNLEIDNLKIESDVVTSVFHFEDSNGQVRNDFLCNEDVILNGTASQGEAKYYIDVWKRPIGTSGAFAWQQRLGTSGWTTGQAGVLNLTQVFANQNYEFESGYEHQVKLATANSPCYNWVETVHAFKVIKPVVSTDFTFNTFCAADGTINVEVAGASTIFGGTHWWRIFETSVAGSTADSNTIGAVTSIKGGTTALFTGLSKNKNYYIKHGIFDNTSNCIGWIEKRKAFSGQVPWNNITTNFDFTNITSNGTSVSVTVSAHSNSPVYVNNHWSISYAPNGNSNITDIPIPSNPSQCCGTTATFNQNLQVNTWYFIKHGITNDCINWRETRRVFRVYLQESSGEKPSYKIEVREEEEVDVFLEEERSLLYPNPSEKGEYCTLKMNAENIKAIYVNNALGRGNKEVRFEKVDKETVRFLIDENFIKGINFIKIFNNKEKSFDEKLIVK